MKNQLIDDFTMVKANIKARYSKRPTWLPAINQYDYIADGVKYCNDIVYKLICDEFLSDKKITVLIGRFANCKAALNIEGDLDTLFQLYYVEMFDEIYYYCMRDELYETISNLEKFSDKVGYFL
jgi:hypothetical protein